MYPNYVYLFANLWHKDTYSWPKSLLNTFLYTFLKYQYTTIHQKYTFHRVFVPSYISPTLCKSNLFWPKKYELDKSVMFDPKKTKKAQKIRIWYTTCVLFTCFASLMPAGNCFGRSPFRSLKNLSNLKRLSNSFKSKGTTETAKFSQITSTMFCCCLSESCPCGGGGSSCENTHTS